MRRFIVLSVVMSCLFIPLVVSASEIHKAVESQDIVLINRLLAEDSKRIHETTAGGATPLHAAAGLDNEQILNLLLAKGADIHAKTTKGYTPLHWAAYMNAGKSAALLIKKGADVKAVTLAGDTALNLAIKEKATEAVAVLAKNTSATYTDKALDSYSEGEQAMKAGDLQRAYKVFTKLLRADPGNEKINFAYGMTCFSLKDYSRARLAFSRVLQINPANDRARVDLGRTYMSMNQPELARREFETVLSHNPPAVVKKNIEDWLKLAKSGSKKWRWMGRVDGGLFHDDNVNVGPESATISISPIIFGSQAITELILDDSSQPNESDGAFVSLSMSGICDVGERGHWAFTADGAYYQNWLTDADNFESLFGQVVVGARKFAGRSMINLPVKLAHITNGHEPLVNMYGITPALLMVSGTGRDWQWVTSGTAEIRDYDTLDDRDGFYLAASESMKYSFGEKGDNVMMSISIFHDYTDQPHYEHTGITWKMGTQLALPFDGKFYARVSYTTTDYEEKEALSIEERSDTQSQFLVGASKKLTSRIGVDLNHQISNSDSTFGLYQYDRTVTTLSTYLAF